MKKSLKILLYTAAILVIVLVTALIILSRVQHETVRKKVADYVNQQFNGQVTFEDLSLSYLRSFPRIHLKLTGISAVEYSEEIIHIGELGVILNVRDVLNKKVVIEKLVIRDAMMHSAVDSLGNRSKLLNPEKKTRRHRSKRFPR